MIMPPVLYTNFRPDQASPSGNPPGSGISDRGILLQQLQLAHQEIGDPQTAQRRLCLAYGATILKPGLNTIYYGMSRPGDQQIVTQLVNQLIFKRGLAPVRILEVAAGYSYGDTPNHGSPWLSRAIAKAFGSKVEVCISDKIAGETQVFILNPNGALDSVCLGKTYNLRSWPTLAAQPKNTPDGIRFQGIRWRELVTQFPRQAQDLRSFAMNSTYLRPWPTGKLQELEESTLFLRPALDPEFEGNTYQIRAFEGIDCCALERHFGPNSFDLIFARHMPAAFGQKAQQAFLSSADRILSSTGIALVHADQFIWSRDMPRIRDLSWSSFFETAS